MTNQVAVLITSGKMRNLSGQAELPPSVLYGETEIELSPYRSRTVALLHRYTRASVEVGRLPSLLGKEFFRSRVTSYGMGSFEDVVIFVTDMDKAIDKLSPFEKKLIAMGILEEYSMEEVARLLAYSAKTIRRLLPDAVDHLSQILLTVGLMERVERCQGGKRYDSSASRSNRGEYKCSKNVRTPPSDLIS